MFHFCQTLLSLDWILQKTLQEKKKKNLVRKLELLDQSDIIVDYSFMRRDLKLLTIDYEVFISSKVQNHLIVSM